MALPVDMQEHAGEVMNRVAPHLAAVQLSVVSIHATNVSQKFQYSSFYSKCQETKDGREELQLPKSCQPTG